MIGVELQNDPKPVIDACVNNGLLVCKAGGNTIRFLPPLIVERNHIDKAVDKFKNSLKIAKENYGKKSEN